MKTNGKPGILKQTFQSWSEDKAPRLAAALSYYTIFSIAPLLVLVIAIAGFVIASNETIRAQILNEVQNVVGQQGAQMVDTLITNTSRPRDGILASVIGLVSLVFGATGVFIQLKDALNTIWEVTPEKKSGVSGIVSQRISGLLMILGLGFLLLVSLVINTALSALNSYFSGLLGGYPVVAMLLNYAIQVLVITLLFAAIFKAVPDVELRFKDVWLGALITAVLFLVGQYLISLYLTRASPASAYGAAGSLVVLLLWLYYSAQIMFLGAEFTKVRFLANGGQVVPKHETRLMTAVERIQQGIARDQDQDAASRPAETQPERANFPPAYTPIPLTGTASERAGDQKDPNEPEA